MFQGVLLKKVFRSVRKESCMKSGLSLEMAAFAVLSSELGFSKCRLSKSFNCKVSTHYLQAAERLHSCYIQTRLVS